MGEEISSDRVITILQLTQNGTYRPNIAREVGVSKSTVFKYQKKFDLI